MKRPSSVVEVLAPHIDGECPDDLTVRAVIAQRRTSTSDHEDEEKKEGHASADADDTTIRLASSTDSAMAVDGTTKDACSLTTSFGSSNATREPPPFSNTIRTGLVFASSPRHFDPCNPLHKERELRVTCIHKALEDKGLLKRCIVLRHTHDNTTFAGLQQSLPHAFPLSTQDFVKVHLPAYLERCVC